MRERSWIRIHCISSGDDEIAEELQAASGEGEKLSLGNYRLYDKIVSYFIKTSLLNF